MDREIKEYYACGDGWIPLIKKAIQEVARYNGVNRYDEDLGPVEIVDIKEKWGFLDITLNYYPTRYLQENIHNIELESHNMCEFCGNTENVSHKETHGWWMTLCENCRDEELKRYYKRFKNDVL